MRLVKITGGLFLIFILSGCATTIKYTMDKDLYKRGAPLNKKVVVDVFEDKRPEDEHNGAARNKGGFLCTKDKDFKSDVNIQVSQMLIEHFDKANMFSRTELRDIDNNLDADASGMESLSQDGIDLAITGDLSHFYGFQSGEAGGAMLFGALGVLAEAMANPKTVGGNVEYSNVKVIDVRNKDVLWQGNIEDSFEEKDTFYKGPAAYVLVALKKANDKFVRQLDEILQRPVSQQ